ncbi:MULTISPECIES: 4Fe-4S binding protein [unclassified Paludibacterium]|uniref:4Fe-4S binding protein n=1 Tax=unclassified Paludibacterium TaxID=2618429 RepID=UPI001C058978|nr:4Fe-4S binding protein [Paludibacterium sp. B53371]BEV73132.1 4Fe-4S binding protein [Paludibacterium sp. THUN1379]
MSRQLWIRKAGDWLRDHAQLIRWLQWGVVLVYGFLIIVPACLPLPTDSARMFSHLTVFAQFVFWGIWWPFVLLSMVLFGRLWCGVLCPEGALSELAAKHGLGRPIPRWMRWGGWPFVAFAMTTVYGQMVSVYQYPKAVLLVLGGSTVAAVAIGLVYTRGKRAWCRHLCPVNGVFSLLAKLAPWHYRVDEHAWKTSGVIPLKSVDCAPLMPLRHMQGASGCHMCGRCSGHREAIALSTRPWGHEVVALADKDSSGWQTALILYGMLGIAMGAFQWTNSDVFVAIKLWLADWLAQHQWLWALEDSAPWWLLTHYPEVNDSFTWLDGGVLIGYIAGVALLYGTVLGGLLALSVRLAGPWQTSRLHHLAQSLIPLAGCSVFLGLSALTVTLLKVEGVALWWVMPLRFALLGLANLWCLQLAWRILGRWQGRAFVAVLPLLPALGWIDAAWWLMWQ